MKLSKYLLPTLKEAPADSDIISSKLMIRGGFIQKLAAGIYTWLPLGLRVLHKVENIIREEMNKAGAIEIFMPSVQPADLWKESGRYDKYGPELLRFQDRHEREFCFGPTHEEVITDLMRRALKSYKELPINLYQIQTKFRDEIRPRFGVMRGREFIMKDAYSFHLTRESLDAEYENMFRTYNRIFQRLGVEFCSVDADSGNIGGKSSHEFHVLAESGEDAIAFSLDGSYAANLEKAQYFVDSSKKDHSSLNLPMEKVATPNAKTISEVAQFLKLEAKDLVKTLLIKVGTKILALVLRGDHEVNYVKVKNFLGGEDFVFAEDDDIKKLGLEIGSIGPINLPNIEKIIDYSAYEMPNFVCGANEAGFHFVNGQWKRVENYQVADIRNVVPGDISPNGQSKLMIKRGIEVGHIFKLGKKYSEAMKLQVLNEDGKPETLFMGCYGIGVSRLVAAVIEQNHDEHGIIWPKVIAPFSIAILAINYNSSVKVQEVADDLYAFCEKEKIEVLLDDRKERFGVMISDAELIGIPYIIILGEKNLTQNLIEFKNRRTNESCKIALSLIKEELLQVLK